MSSDDSHRPQDPFLSLSLPSPATSLCFLSTRVGGKFESDSTDDSSVCDSDSDDDELVFRSSLVQQSNSKSSSKVRKIYKRQKLLKNRLLVSCHRSGEAILWNCAHQNKVTSILGEGAGMVVKRLEGDDGRLLYQTRDVNGTVAIHSIDRMSSAKAASPSFSVIQTYETFSETFCHATSCHGNANLLALPSRKETTAAVMDVRDPKPVHVTSPVTKGGMVTSLAMSTTNVTGRPILGCGMEGGSVILYDFVSGRSTRGEHALSKDPILALDLAPGAAQSTVDADQEESIVAVAGMAGDIAEVSELPESEQGRVALIKASLNKSNEAVDASAWSIKTRARLSTCRIDKETSYGKPGVAICQFRPKDARVFALGGWDNRVRLFERSKGAPMGILKGHLGSVNALDWAPDAVESGLLATAGRDDSCISFWQCFGTNETI